jgi:predicted RNA-binding Zn-ribbon protein involved in translation (DUF1610 family)
MQESRKADLIRMIKTYKVSCSSCHAEYIVEYGSKNKRKIIYETFSCPDCHNLFSLSNIDDEFKCPNCGKTHLNRYNLHKEENLSYYKKVFEEGMIPKNKYKEITQFWNTVKSDECPKCGKHTLSWTGIEKSQYH